MDDDRHKGHEKIPRSKSIDRGYQLSFFLLWGEGSVPTPLGKTQMHELGDVHGR